MIEKRRILVTGSSGFVGTHFQELSKHMVVPFSWRHDDLAALDLSGVDAVVHLAALVHQMHGAPAEAYDRINIAMTRILAEKAKAAGVGYFLFVSTVKVYGEEAERCYGETTTCSPRDVYARSKYQAECALMAMEDARFKVGIVRPPLIYGEGVGANMLSLIKLIERMPLLPFGSITNRRSMIYVGNLCRVIEAMLDEEASGIYNVADAVPVSTSVLVGCIAEALGKRLYLFRPPLIESLLKSVKPELYRRLFQSLCIDTSKLYERFPSLELISTEEGMKKMVKWYKNVD